MHLFRAATCPVYQTLTPGGLCELFVAVIRSFAYIFGPGASEEEAAVVQLMRVLTEGEEVGAARLPSNFVFYGIYPGPFSYPIGYALRYGSSVVANGLGYSRHCTVRNARQPQRMPSTCDPSLLQHS